MNQKILRGTILFISLIVIMTSCFKSTPKFTPTYEFGKRFGGEQLDFAKSVVNTVDGGFAFVGVTESMGFGGKDVYLVKTDAEGNEIWSKTYGGVEEDLGVCLKQVVDKGYVVVGSTKSLGSGEADIYFLKIDQNGEQEWSMTFGNNYYDEGSCVTQTVDEGYLIVGGVTDFNYAVKDIALYKISAAGVQQWSKVYGEAMEDEMAYDIKDTGDGFIILGRRGNESATNIYLLKIDYSGNVIWEKEYDKVGFEVGFNLKKTVDGNFVIAGLIELGAGDLLNTNMYLVKVDPEGNILWEKNYGVDGQWEYEEAYCVQPTLDLGFAICGRAKSAVMLLKTNSEGDMLWKKTFGEDNGPNPEFGFSVIQNNSGQLITVGGKITGTEGDAFLLKTNHIGDTTNLN